MTKPIFVFGSNLLGIHKKGAALCAFKKHGAIIGQGSGMQGSSYAIPTKKTPYESLSLLEVNYYVAEFLMYAKHTPENIYVVTKVGCGLAGFTPEQIAPMFEYASELPHVKFTEEFIYLIPSLKNLIDRLVIFDVN